MRRVTDTMTSPTRLAGLSAAGVSVWLDDLSREHIRSGKLARLIAEYHVVGVTTNPTIFANALANGQAYDEQVRELAKRGADLEQAVRELTTTDVRDACDVFLETFQSTGGVDGRVSIEVDPRMARDAEKTVVEALDLAKTIDRPNLLVKIPATEEGLPAITRVLSEGVSVNVTLIFSIERYRQVMEAFFAGMEQAKANGHDLSRIHSVASFFVSRVDTEIDKRLQEIGTDEAKALLGKAAVANARRAWAAYQEVFAGQRWQALKDAGANPQRPLWASTGTKNPEYSDTLYVDELIYPGTVSTMPEKTLLAAADHAKLEASDDSDPDEVFQRLADLGVDLDDVFRVLEDEGVSKFDKSWSELLETVNGQLVAASEG
jgi:transaldolase